VEAVVVGVDRLTRSRERRMATNAAVKNGRFHAIETCAINPRRELSGTPDNCNGTTAGAWRGAASSSPRAVLAFRCDTLRRRRET
jgi:hypothetical protein